MRVFKTKSFARLAAKAPLGDDLILEASRRARIGLAEAQLGKHLLKLRLARTGEGRSGGHRAVVVLVNDGFALFAHLFAKNEAADLTPRETKHYREFAKLVAGLSNAQIEALLDKGEWSEIEDDQKDGST